ncbi:nucleoside-diphosphate-sugar epimerase [Neolewinella xylanilytica]|uniref:Nucleoside-diphosphate-sugar epimerase n=1 Tax=Neolewinella xylanilytica TaxID=1514080 RepID=A0A2S6I0P9_9BACT|nr:NAD-dependent epimerase/dehydratase family protein [Neolewinella xylanilytica]PPK84540.1 nucleoside-diphosphate-sugar epimerase [Neolewinella xylanilytica]
MQTIDRSKPVLVTGATGYVAGWLVKKLLLEGFTVHAPVRQPDNEAKRAHLDELAATAPGTIRYFRADLLDEGSYTEAMQGCELVFHTASPFSPNVDNPERELIEPAVKGTKNVLNGANAVKSVKRVVLTSSCAAIYTDATDCQRAPGGVLTESVWNTTASLDYQPYAFSKTLAEKTAWDMANAQSRWDLVTINPCLVMGPTLNPGGTTSESLSLLRQLGDGTMRSGVPNVNIGLVDVRDVADAHYLAAFTPEAKGRYITCAHNTSFPELARALQPKYGKDYPIPTRTLPKWLVMIVGPLVNKSLSRRFVRNNVGVPWTADNSKIRNQLGINFRPLKMTMEDAFEVLVEEGMV